jgi:hypothetical protein
MWRSYSNPDPHGVINLLNLEINSNRGIKNSFSSMLEMTLKSS